MAHKVCELMWAQSLLREIGIFYDKSTMTHWDNQIAIYIISLVFHERTKHIKVDYHFIRVMVIAT